jgi:beta-glucosidase
MRRAVMRGFAGVFIGCAVVLILGAPAGAAPDPETRAVQLLARMTLAEKIDLITGNLNDLCGFYNAPVPRVGIPALCMADAPSGVRINNPATNEQRATQMPHPIALAATWNPQLARPYGDLIGDEAFNTGHNVHLGPATDIARTPFGARTAESFGEDPLLQSRMVVPYIQGVQSHPVMSTLKHFIANNQEAFRSVINVVVGEQALQEIYLPPFDAAVKNADVAAMMCSFNRVNGVFACENRTLLNDILKRQLGFPGFVLSDYGANHTTVAAANAGLDQEQPGDPIGMWGAKLLAAVQSGSVSVATVDDHALRILREMFARGIFDQPPQINPLPVQAHGQVARNTAAQGMVLLKNTNHTLPLSPQALRSVAVIGPDADDASAAIGGSGLVKPTYTVSALDGIRSVVGAAHVEYAPGTDPIGTGDLLPGPPAVPSSVLSPAGGAAGETGLHAEYWPNADFVAQPVLVRTDPQVNLLLGFFNFPGFSAGSPKLPVTPPSFNHFLSARWTGTFRAPTTGAYSLALTSLGHAQLVFDGRLLIDNSGREVGTTAVTIQLTAGEAHAVRIDYRTDSPRQQDRLQGAHIRFAWEPPPNAVPAMMRTAVDLARRSDVAIVVTRTYESEAFLFDRNNLELPNNQDQLVREVAAANPHTIVVLMSGTPITMRNWLDRTPAVLEAWYAGQEQGNALADVLFGAVNPSGKLPLTFPVDEQHVPLSMPDQYPGIVSGCPVGGGGSGGGVVGDPVSGGNLENCTVNYSEGLSVGYRGYDAHSVTPQYPFGFGLSYTTFSYSGLQISPTRTSGTRLIRVRFRVANTGSRDGAEVAQIYLGLPAGHGEPPRRLVGFAKVQLESGDSRRVTLTLDPRRAPRPLSFWNVSTHSWEIAPGDYRVFVGASSRDIRLTGTLRVGQEDDRNSADTAADSSNNNSDEVTID